jgi:hypothetical protein
VDRVTSARGITRALCVAIGVGLAVTPATARAHGVAGQRFFPTTFAVDDPFMTDELSLLLHSRKASDEAGAPPVRTTSLGAGYSKTVLPGFGVELEGEYLWVRGADAGSASGFGNLAATLKVQVLTSEAHETILSVGLTDEVGGTGAGRVGAESFSTLSPALFFGKGFGDLPSSMALVRPLAITGVVGASFPTQRITEGVENPTTLTWAFTVQYSLMYLQSAVKDVGLGAPLDRLVAIVEVPLQTCLDADCAGRTTWTVNPGVAWIGKYTELGVAAEIPVKPRSGGDIGVFVLLHFFVDDLFSSSIGRPLFP